MQIDPLSVVAHKIKFTLTMSALSTQLTALKCSRRGCHLPPSSVIFACSNPACDRAMHLVCCQKFIFGFHNLQPLVSPVPATHAVACTKKCYMKVAKTQVMAVETNGATLTIPKHSESILIDWLTTQGNYDRYRGSGNGGLRKIQFAAMISARIKDAGVRKTRTPKDVQNKIEYVEKCFRCAHDWAHTETGEGLRESDTGTYEEALLRKCPWYFDIREIFEDRANARPLHTTDEMFQDTESGSDDDDVKVLGVRSSDFLDDETEDEDDVKLAPVSRSLFIANDGNNKQRYSHLEPSLFAPIEDSVKDSVDDRRNDEVDYCYDDDDDDVDAEVEAEEVVGGDKGNLESEKENPSTKSSTKAAAVATTKEASKEKGKELKSTGEKKSTVPLSINRKKENVPVSTTKKKRKTDSSADDPFSMEVMKCFSVQNNKKEATERFRSRELYRHNKAMEDLAAREQDLRERQSEFDFKIKRLENYRELKAKFEPDFIRAVFPEMAPFIDAEALIGNGQTFNNSNPIAERSPSDSACTVASATNVSINVNNDCNDGNDSDSD